MRSLAPLVAAATLAVATALPTAAAADPLCVGAGYSVLGSGTDKTLACVPTPLEMGNVNAGVGDPSLVQIRVNVDFPAPPLAPVPG